MANVHGFENSSASGSADSDQTRIGDRGLLDYDEVVTKNPAEENLFNMLHLSLCPQLTLTSFCTLIVLLDIAMFAVQTLNDGVETSGKLLEAKVSGSVILSLGKMTVPIKKQHQLYRLLTCLVLHGNFSHLLNNVISTLAWGSLVEKLVGRTRTAAIYLLAGSLC